MDISPYLLRRLRTLDEFLEAKGSDAKLFFRDDGQPRGSAPVAADGPGGGHKGERVRLTLVSSTDLPPRHQPADRSS